MYLGDGCISRHPPGVWRLRITLDAAYPAIVVECAHAISTAFPGRRANVLKKGNERCVEISSYWKHWPCYFPQHGPGPKHTRPIVLAYWQRRIVATYIERFLRGLIHSDGTRIIATERKGRYVRRAPRNAFRTGPKTSAVSFEVRARSRRFTAPERARSRSPSTARRPLRASTSLSGPRVSARSGADFGCGRAGPSRPRTYRTEKAGCRGACPRRARGRRGSRPRPSRT
jgi:hypothetical protein